MKTLFKRYWWVILSLIVITVFGLQKCQINKLKDQVQLQNVELSTLNDSVTVLKGKNGDLTFKVQSVQIEKDNAKKALELAGFEIKDLKQREIKWKDVNFALKAELEAWGDGTVVLRDTIIVKGDTIMAKVGKWNNKFLYLNPFLVKNKLDFTYTYKTPIDLISEKKGKSYVVSAYLGDKNASITTANSITIVPKKRWYDKPYLWGIAGLGAGYFIFK